MFYTGFVALRDAHVRINVQENKKAEPKGETTVFCIRNFIEPDFYFSISVCPSVRRFRPSVWEIDGFIKHPLLPALRSTARPEKEVVKGIFISLFSFREDEARGEEGAGSLLAYTRSQELLFGHAGLSSLSLSLSLSLFLSLSVFVCFRGRKRPIFPFLSPLK